MALGACYVVKRVRRAAYVRAVESVGVTFQAGVNRLFRRELKKGNDGRFSSVGLHMSTPGTVAALATRVRRFLFPASDAFKMGIFIKSQPDVGMTRFARRAANVGILLGLLRR
jgi:hypothetical protein